MVIAVKHICVCSPPPSPVSLSEATRGNPSSLRRRPSSTLPPPSPPPRDTVGQSPSSAGGGGASPSRVSLPPGGGASSSGGGVARRSSGDDSVLRRGGGQGTVQWCCLRGGCGLGPLTPIRSGSGGAWVWAMAAGEAWDSSGLVGL